MFCFEIFLSLSIWPGSQTHCQPSIYVDNSVSILLHIHDCPQVLTKMRMNVVAPDQAMQQIHANNWTPSCKQISYILSKLACFISKFISPYWSSNPALCYFFSPFYIISLIRWLLCNNDLPYIKIGLNLRKIISQSQI